MRILPLVMVALVLVFPRGAVARRGCTDKLGGIDDASRADAIALVYVRSAEETALSWPARWVKAVRDGIPLLDSLLWADHPLKRTTSMLEVEECWAGDCPDRLVVEDENLEYLPFVPGTRAVALLKRDAGWSTLASTESSQTELGPVPLEGYDALCRRVLAWREAGPRGTNTDALVRAALAGSTSAVRALAYSAHPARNLTTEEREALAAEFIATPPEPFDVADWLTVLGDAGGDAVTRIAVQAMVEGTSGTDVRDLDIWMRPQVVARTGGTFADFREKGHRRPPVPRDAVTAFMLFGL